MNKSELIMELASSNKINLKDAETVVNSFFDTIVEGLSKEERAELRGFGSFSVRKYGAYVGRNPKSGEAIPVKSKKMPIFKPGKELRAIVNQGLADDDYDDE
ncbi:MAG: integration host factor subunit beta [Deltaproteobacteria bacterium]|nr:integration host factor subunit beta [Deltaproteobacteria bacterium]